MKIAQSHFQNHQSQNHDHRNHDRRNHFQNRMIIMIIMIIGFFESRFAHSQEFIASPQPLLVDKFSSHIFVKLNGRHQWWSQSLPETKIGATVELDVLNQEMIFKKVKVDFSETLNLDRWIWGRRIRGSITFDSELEFVDDERILLISETKTRFSLSHDDFRRELGRSEQTKITGRYSFSGPTETVEGTFSLSPYWWRAVDYSGWTNIDTTNPINGLTFSDLDQGRLKEETRSLRFFFDNYDNNEDGRLFSVTVDGVTMTFDLYLAGFTTPPSFTFIGESGDIDRNGVVNIADLILLNDHINNVRNVPTESFSRADINDDGTIDSIDQRRLIDLILEF